MRLDRPDTLAFHLDLPHRRATPFGDTLTARSTKDAVRRTFDQAHTGVVPMAYPDFEAAEFYALNQIVAALQSRFSMGEALPQWAVRLASRYADTLSAQTVRMFHYVLLITTRESRHLHSKDSFFSSNPNGTKCAATAATFVKGLPSGSLPAASHFMKSAPNVALSSYTATLVSLFNHGSFSGGYGGPAWGNIAAALHAYTSGKTSAEVFVDTAYTLAHNNGPIFNKAMYYNGYTSHLVNILDIQRSGQVCEMVLTGLYPTALSSKVPAGFATLLDDVKLAKKFMPDAIGDYVDWFKVEALGSVLKYPKEKAAQIVTHGKPQEAAPKPPPITLVGGVPMSPTSTLTVIPGKTFQLYKRVSKS